MIPNTFDEGVFLGLALGKSGDPLNLREIEITTNGDYDATKDSTGDYNGYSKVTVEVTHNVSSLSVTVNGTYNASDYNCDALNPVTVNVSSSMNIQALNVTSNGTYNASDYGCDGFTPVVVNIPYETLYKWVTGDTNSGVPTQIDYPSGTEYSDIYNQTSTLLLKGTCGVLDNTIGYGIRIVYSTYDDDDGYVYGSVDLQVYDSSGNRVKGATQDWVITDPDDETLTESFTITGFTVNSNTGKVSYTLNYTGTQDGESWNETYNRSATFSELIGFGTSGNTYTVAKV